MPPARALRVPRSDPGKPSDEVEVRMTTTVRLMTWNVNHRVRERRIPPEMAPAIFALEPDVVVLTEFVDGPSRTPFYDALSDGGFRHRLCSSSSGRHNRVLIASRTPIEPGDIVAPPIAPSVPSNALHAKLPALGLWPSDPRGRSRRMVERCERRDRRRRSMRRTSRGPSLAPAT
jgi:hypothetical protein